jgi:NAD(P)-dependent dehydrogenase (short-subunit alcohol dehydrogenase family)
MTQMNAEKDRALLEAMSDQVPLGRFASTHEIAAPCLFLLSDAAGYITGFDLRVDGGHGVW